MGRPKLAEPKVHVGGRVSKSIWLALEGIKEAHRWTTSQALIIALEESPRIKARLSRNGQKKRKGKWT